MNLRPFGYVAAGGVVGLIGVALWNANHRPGSPPPPDRPGVATVSPVTPRPRPDVSAAPMPQFTPPPATPAPLRTSAQKEALAEMENVQFMFRDFRTRLGGNPVGTNAEIMKSVMGGNSFHAKFGPPEGQSLNEQGELLDRWGTPYFFHQLSRDEMEIRSAGPDRTLWTTDDVVTK